MRWSLGILVALIAVTANAEDLKEGWSHESEASIVTVSGNTEGENYAFKQKTQYKFELDTLTLKGRYLRATSVGIETARSWDASLRWDRELSERWALFLAHGAEADPYAGYVQRDNTDVGAKHWLAKSENESLSIDAGFRYTRLLPEVGGREDQRFARLASEWKRQLTPTVSARLWAEYLPNLEISDAYLANGEPSLQVMLTSVFSLKLAYLARYNNAPPVGVERLDTTYTTALVAKF